MPLYIYFGLLLAMLAGSLTLAFMPRRDGKSMQAQPVLCRVQRRRP